MVYHETTYAPWEHLHDTHSKIYKRLRRAYFFAIMDTMGKIETRLLVHYMERIALRLYQIGASASWMTQHPYFDFEGDNLILKTSLRALIVSAQRSLHAY